MTIFLAIVMKHDCNQVIGKCSVVFSAPSGTYLVLDTDYKSFSAVYSCEAKGNLTLEFAWILSRETTTPDELLRAVANVFAGFGIDLGKFQTTYQGKDCVYPSWARSRREWMRFFNVRLHIKEMLYCLVAVTAKKTLGESSFGKLKITLTDFDLYDL